MDMEDDEDELYDPPEVKEDPPQAHGGLRMADVEDDEEEGEEVEEEDSDDEVNFITDAKEQPKAEPSSQPKRPVSINQVSSAARKASATPTPEVKSEVLNDMSKVLTDDRPGTDFLARHTSTLEPNGNPIHPTTGKPIMSTDFDTDFPSESSKPWRKPGSDITDYFNYGFDEFTWASYCLKQQQMPKEIKEINNQAEQLKAFVEGIPGGAMPGAAAMPQMPGMPSEAEMQQMFQGMMSSGMDPTSMDSNQFMQMMMSGNQGFGAGQAPSQPQQMGYGGGGVGAGGGPGGGGGGFHQGGNYGGRGRNRGRR